MDYFAVGVMAFECMFGRVSHNESNNYNRDLMLENHGKRSEIIYYLNKYKLKEMRSQEAGLLKQLTLSIK